MDKPAVNRYRGDFIAWTGGCGFLGEGGGSPISPHSHYAIQLVIGAPDGLRVRFGRSAQWVSRAAALVPLRATHTIEETGMPLRTYVLWRRLLHVWTLMMQGESLSAAAHAAGFADSAHLSRTSRTMFGLAPSSLT